LYRSDVVLIKSLKFQLFEVCYLFQLFISVRLGFYSMASLFDKFLVAVGLLALAHAAYSAAQHRVYLRLTEQEFTILPADVTVQTLGGLLIACYGIVRVVGRFREIRTITDLEGRTWDSMSTHVAFYSFNHRGKYLSDIVRG
jgi:hypothetical protein